MIPHANIIATLPALLFFLWSGQGHCTDPARELVLGFPRVGYPPYLMPQGAGQQGIMTRVLDQMAREQGYRIRIQYLPDSRTTALQLIGKLDVTPLAKEWGPGPERFLWSLPVITVADHIVQRKGEEFDINTVANLHGRSVGAMIGFQYPSFETYFTEGTITRQNTQTYSSLLKMVLLQRTDAAILDRNVALWLIRSKTELDGRHFVISEQGFDPVGYRFRFSRRDNLTAFVETLNTRLKAYLNSREFEQLMDHYR